MPAEATHVGHREDMRWQLRAACVNDPDGSWELEPKGQLSPANRHALAVCAECSVRGACLAFALNTEGAWPRWGIWGGKVPTDREALAPSWRTRQRAGRRAD